jgi:hypothetical protein
MALCTTLLADDDLTKPIQVSPDGHFLMQPDGNPFFWLSDAAWALSTRTKREEADEYLRDRARKGYTVIAIEALAYFDRTNKITAAANVPNLYGQPPFIGGDFSRPNPEYFAYLDWVIDRAANYGLRVALVPVWGLFTITNGLLTPEKAKIYGKWLAVRYHNRGIIWVLGGDLTPLWRPHDQFGREKGAQITDFRPVIDAMAAGIAEGEGGRPFMTYHIACCSWPGTAPARTSLYFSDRHWLSMNYVQQTSFLNPARTMSFTGFSQIWASGYEYEPIAEEYASQPTRPVISADPKAEDIPYEADLPPPEGVDYDNRVTPKDVRFYAYESVFTGAAGAGYNHNSITVFYDPIRFPADPNMNEPWRQALNAPGGREVPYIKPLMLSRPYFTRIPDQSVILGDAGVGAAHICATRDRTGSYMMIYLPLGQAVTVDMIKLSGSGAKAWWFDPRGGSATSIEGRFPTNQALRFTPPSNGVDSDWVLVIDDESKGFASPAGGG